MNKETAVTTLVNARELLMTLATYIANAFQLSPNNVYYFLLGIISLYIGKKIMNIFFVSTNGRQGWYFGVSAVIFYFLGWFN